MKKKSSVWILVLVFVLFIGGASVLYSRLSADAKPEQLSVQADPTTPPAQSGQPAQESEPPKVEAPDFTVEDADGEEVRLSDYVGKPIVLNFWASWCSPCKSEMPEFNEAWEELDGEVQFLMVNMTDGARETVDTAKEYVEGQGFSFPVFFDTGSEAAMAYGAYSLPTTYFIDAEGYVVARAVGAIDGDTLQKGLDLIHLQE
ncbi:TlpA disulfide reductase family protein [uncultured Intestinimonas sp.]|uniref:TlpA family protein disulfide reductase n=1 Tax=uncultured Intestinimonas sp. TaxID=1689265 RepID=UPI0025DB5CE1|nr:TlpA disulfide reductase family protein [uncultured Intestinimonas sp.]